MAKPKRRSGPGSYPWKNCIRDQKARGYGKERAEKICGSIKARSQAAHPAYWARRNPPGWVLPVAVGTIAVLAVGGYAVVRHFRRHDSMPYGGVLISCGKHLGEDVCVWQVEDRYAYSITGGVAPNERYNDPAAAALAGRIFVEVLKGQKQAA